MDIEKRGNGEEKYRRRKWTLDNGKWEKKGKRNVKEKYVKAKVKVDGNDERRVEWKMEQKKEVKNIM